MDIEKLTARNKDGLAYLVNVKSDEQEVDSPHKNTLQCILDCFERLAQYEEAEIARQSATSEEVAEEIERLTDVIKQTREAAKELKEQKYAVNLLPVYEKIKSLELQITALQAYQPWIPVSNIKPEKSGRYIAYVPEHWTADSHKEGKVIIAYFRELNYEGKRRAWDDGAWGISGDVTHYMPLPEPPKGE